MIKPYYEDATTKLYLGDCRMIAPSLGRFDLLLTDPPYGIGEARGKNKKRTNLVEAKDYGIAAWDDKPPADWVLRMLIDQAKWCAIFGANFFSLPPSSCWLVWDKDNTGEFADCELAWTNFPKAVRKFRWRWNGMIQEHGSRSPYKEDRVHPTQKPRAVMKWAITIAPELPTSIFDPFAGSGTTLLAAKESNIPAVGIEIDERFCEIAAGRLSQGVLQLDGVEPRGT